MRSTSKATAKLVGPSSTVVIAALVPVCFIHVCNVNPYKSFVEAKVAATSQRDASEESDVVALTEC